MLPILLLLSLLYQGHAVDYGTDFIMAFPENIAYYFPGESKLLIKCTALHANTDINITGMPNLLHLTAGQENITEIKNMEETMMGPSTKTIRITSTNNITVIAITKRGDSMQSNVVLPLTSLDTSYLIPFPNYTLLTSKLNPYQPSDWSSSALIFNFRLMIINAEGQVNTVTVKGQKGDTTDSPYTIKPYEMVQIQGSDPWVKVTSTAKVAVILTHPCVDTLGCRCNMIMHQIRPISAQGSEFIVPPFVNANISRLFVTAGVTTELTIGQVKKTIDVNSLELLNFLPDNTNSYITLKDAGSLRLVRPGLMLDFLPMSKFAGCFLVSPTSKTKSQLVIIVPTNETSNLRQNSGPITTALSWNAISSTGYSWAIMTIDPTLSGVVWHMSSKIGVYLLEKSPSGITYGGPAISLSDNPDPRGCVVSDDQFVVFNDTLSWQASRSFCRSKQMVLASPSFQFTQDKMTSLLKDSFDAGDVWLGLRRNLLTSVWYWQDNTVFDFANWADGHPDKLSNDFCVSTSMDENFEWSSQRCCNTLKPLCARVPEILSTITPLSQPVYDNTPTSTPGLVAVPGTIE